MQRYYEFHIYDYCNIGASLVIDSANLLNANIRAMSGSSVIVKNNGKINLWSNAEFYTETGANLEIDTKYW